MAKKPEKNQKQGAPKEVQRGTNDDLEILTLILEENSGLRMRVMQRIRAMRGIQAELNGNNKKQAKD